MSLAPRPGALLLLHDPRCSKCRALVAELGRRGVEFDARDYLAEPLDASELEELLTLLALEPHALLRTKEAEYAAAGLSPASTKGAVFSALVRHPRLLERPILIAAERAAIGRPAERALALLGDAV